MKAAERDGISDAELADLTEKCFRIADEQGDNADSIEQDADMDSLRDQERCKAFVAKMKAQQRGTW